MIKKTKGKRMALGGSASSGKMVRPMERGMPRTRVAPGNDIPMMGRRRPPAGGRTNYPEIERPGGRSGGVSGMPVGAPESPIGTGVATPRDMPNAGTFNPERLVGAGARRDLPSGGRALMRKGGAVKGKKMAKGGMAKGAGCAKKGVKKPRIM